MEKVWKDIEGFEDAYQISSDGEVFNKRKGELAKVCVDKVTGYVKVGLYANGQSYTYTVHRLVAKAFIHNPDGLIQVHHKDGNKVNNTVDNLEWVSHKTHSEKMLPEQKAKFRQTYQNNLRKRQTC